MCVSFDPYCDPNDFGYMGWVFWVSGQHHIFVSYELDTIQTYTSIIDNNTFPQQKFPLTTPESLSSLRRTRISGSIDGLLCFCSSYRDVGSLAVIWNPTIRKSVGIVIPFPKAGYNVVGFGVCPVTTY